jgi:hypothetical protein
MVLAHPTLCPFVMLQLLCHLQQFIFNHITQVQLVAWFKYQHCITVNLQQ